MNLKRLLTAISIPTAFVAFVLFVGSFETRIVLIVTIVVCFIVVVCAFYKALGTDDDSTA